ncbi:MAG: hypothetical protein GX892_07770 [Thermoanaerobacteraceae bacterium]|nr:hypothetical protein [Thermoanaerobacteraceae bacterium]
MFKGKGFSAEGEVSAEGAGTVFSVWAMWLELELPELPHPGKKIFKTTQ